jgi:hypothetical protein
LGAVFLVPIGVALSYVERTSMFSFIKTVYKFILVYAKKMQSANAVKIQSEYGSLNKYKDGR